MNIERDYQLSENILNSHIYSKSPYLFRRFHFEITANGRMLTATTQGCQRKGKKQKDPYLIVRNPKPELRKSHVVLSQIDHCNLFPFETDADKF